MRKKIEWWWEQLDETTGRAKVIGGWVLMKVIVGKDKGISTVFIPDRDHEWAIVQPIIEEKTPVKVAASDFENPKK